MDPSKFNRKRFEAHFQIAIGRAQLGMALEKSFR